MPELPEVQTLVNQLNQVLIGKTIDKVLVSRDKNFIGQSSDLIGYQISSITRFAKIILIHLTCEKPNSKSSIQTFPLIAVHLKMTGQLIYDNDQKRVAGGHPSQDFFATLPNQYTRVIIKFLDKSHLFFNDQRTFGWLKVIRNKFQFNSEFKNLSGIEPFSPDFTWQNLKKRLSSSTRPIKLSILDQAKIVGIGNIYANDGLFLSRISPTRKTNTLTNQEWQKLTQSLRQVLEKSIKLGGTSQANYLHLDGSKGDYQDHFLVYAKVDQLCSVCQKPIKRIKLGGRGTFYCSHCQK